MIINDGRLTMKQKANLVGNSSGKVFTILKKRPALKKISEICTIFFLSEKQKRLGLKCVANYLKSTKYCNERRLSEIVTGDEARIHYLF